MTDQRVGILDYGAGNFGSVCRALQALDLEPVSVGSPEECADVDRLIFPGVGSASQAMTALRERGLDEALRSFANSGRPLLGICVGMQVLGTWSAEGNTPCLGLLPYSVEKFECPEPIPHMGWNSLQWNRNHPQFHMGQDQLADDANLYFVHSYAAFLHVAQTDDSCTLASAEYGGRRFSALVARGNIWGAQCHVEKSGRAGLQFLRNFLRLRSAQC